VGGGAAADERVAGRRVAAGDRDGGDGRVQADRADVEGVAAEAAGQDDGAEAGEGEGGVVIDPHAVGPARGRGADVLQRDGVVAVRALERDGARAGDRAQLDAGEVDGVDARVDAAAVGR